MRVEIITVVGLKTTVSIGGGMDVDLVQRDAVGVTCMIELGNRPVRIVAEDGIDFIAPNGLRVSLQDGADITDLCDIDAIEADIKWLVEERAESNTITRRAMRQEFAVL